MFDGGSSKTFKRALIEDIFNVSILSIIINLSLVLKDDLFKLLINSLIWLISIFFFSLKTSTNNKLQQQLEDEEKKEFNASEVAIQNTPPVEQEQVLPNVSPLTSDNQSIPEIPTNTSIPSESTPIDQSPMEQPLIDQLPMEQPSQMNIGDNENDLDLLNKENNN